MNILILLYCTITYTKPYCRYSSENVPPGSPAQLTLQSDPGALCGLSAVDKSVSLTPNPNRVTVSRVQALKEAMAKRRVVSDRNRGGAGCRNANLLFQAFERLGLFLMSDQILLVRSRWLVCAIDDIMYRRYNCNIDNIA